MSKSTHSKPRTSWVVPLETSATSLPRSESQESKKVNGGSTATTFSSTATSDKFVSFPGVDILKAGTWNAQTGRATITRADLAAIVAAAKELPEAVLKLGHTRPEPDAPAIGFAINLRLVDNGNTLCADLVDVPQWLAVDLPRTYPQRSVEITRNFVTNHKVYRCVLTALALLGQAHPACSSLKSLRTYQTQEG